MEEKTRMGALGRRGYQGQVIAIGVKAGNQSGTWRHIDAQALCADGDRSNGVDNCRGAPAPKLAPNIEPPRAAQVFPVTIPTEQMERREKLRSSSWIWPVSLISWSWGS